MYNIRNVFKQEPNAIREVVLSILAVPILLEWWEIGAEAVAGVGLAISLLLGLFYVRPLSASVVALKQWGEAIQQDQQNTP